MLLPEFSDDFYSKWHAAMMEGIRLPNARWILYYRLRDHYVAP